MFPAHSLHSIFFSTPQFYRQSGSFAQLKCHTCPWFHLSGLFISSSSSPWPQGHSRSLLKRSRAQVDVPLHVYVQSTVLRAHLEAAWGRAYHPNLLLLHLPGTSRSLLVGSQTFGWLSLSPKEWCKRWWGCCYHILFWSFMMKIRSGFV